MVCFFTILIIILKIIRKIHRTRIKIDMKKALFILVFGIFAIFNTVFAQKNLDNICISEEEMKLYNLIDDLRKEYDFNKIAISKSLMYVAQQHAKDLYDNRPHEKGGCNLNSWSDAGTWTACCFTEDFQQVKCMNNKPQELTDYTAIGWELAFDNYQNPQQTIDAWIKNGVYKEILINKGGFDKNVWAAIGIAVYKGYAVVWFGEDFDTTGNVAICKEGEQLADNQELSEEFETQTDGSQASSDAQFYIIYGSYNTADNANRATRGLKMTGYRQAQVIQTANSPRFRVALQGFNDEQTARQKKASIDLTTWLLIQ